MLTTCKNLSCEYILWDTIIFRTPVIIKKLLNMKTTLQKRQILDRKTTSLRLNGELKDKVTTCLMITDAGIVLSSFFNNL